MNSTTRHGPGICAMRGGCGKKSIFTPELPCPDDGDADETTNELATLLSNVCGPSFDVPDTVCCTQDQVEALRDNLLQAEPIIASCPACRNNFRSFYCHFTCSPDQSTFLRVVETQPVGSAKTIAVKELDVFVSDNFRDGFYDSCKDVQFGATNSFAMDLIGGGAKTSLGFLKYMGTERPGLGSPFQINFPDPSSSIPPGNEEEITPVNPNPLSCSDSSMISARCTCVDCPSICPTLPYLPPPRPPHHPRCHIGSMSCTSFVLILIYGISVLALLLAYSFNLTLRARQRRYERLALLAGEDGGHLEEDIDGEGAPLSPTTSQPRIGIVDGLKRGRDRSADEDGTGDRDSYPNSGRSGSSHFGMGRGASLLDPIDALQPRQSKVNVALRSFFYHLGLFCATRPFPTFIIASMVITLLNLGWKSFAIETDPVRLWVAPGSEAVLQKNHFDENFGPFFRPQQIFITASSSSSSSLTKPVESSSSTPSSLDADDDEENRDDLLSLPNPSEPVLSYARLDWWLEHEEAITSLKSYPNGYTFQDVCFSPAGPGTPCVVQSVSAWFQGYLDEDTWEETVEGCAKAPAECLPDFGQPIEPKFVLGGVEEGKGWTDAKSMVVTFVVSGSLDPKALERAEEWERTLREYLEALAKSAKEEGGAWIAFSTGVSLEEELNKSTNTDYKTVVLSYVVMFLYISLTLGGSGGSSWALFFGEDGVFPSLWDKIVHIPVLLRLVAPPPADPSRPSSTIPPPTLRFRTRLARLFSLLPTLLSVNSKFTLGLFGIALVLIAISTSVGLFSFLGVKVTLIIAEVIPFLVLAVGVDNIFILVHELNRQNAIHGPGASRASVARAGQISHPGEDSFADDLGIDDDDDEVDDEASPSYLSPEERVARSLARMGPSILLSSLTETVAFALGALVPMPAVRNFALYAAGSVALDAVLQVTVFVSAMTLDLKRVEATRMDCFPCIRLQPPIGLYDAPAPVHSGEGMISRFIRRSYAPFLLKKEVKSAVVVAFAGLFLAAAMGVQRIDLGLDQRLALPSDSYLVPYFDALDKYLDVGPPVYFIADHVDVSSRSGQQALCGRFTTCQDLSIANTLEAERKRPDVSFIANPPAVWIDDFLNWLNPVLETCCRVRIDDPDVFCTPRDPERRCKPCFLDHEPPFDITMGGLPEGEEFMKYLRHWLVSPTDEECPLGGKSSYGNAISLSADNSSVVASHFRTYHTPLKTQEDFINALAAARRVADDLSRRTGATVYPYSLFYVFFDQYAHVVSITVQVLSLALLSILLVTSLLLGSWRTGAVVTLTCALVVFEVMGMMGAWGISLNAISLVNLVISLGIAVEFCSHVARAFMGAGGGGLPFDHPSGPKERDERAWSALVDVGASVFSGITMTKLIGVSVLAFTRSKLLEVYFFRMWLSLIVAGALHGLVLLPVLLSYFGGQGFEAGEDSDEEWMGKVARGGAGMDYAPFQDNDSVESI